MGDIEIAATRTLTLSKLAFIHTTLIECRTKLERAYGRCNWVDKAIEICSDKMEKES